MSEEFDWDAPPGEIQELIDLLNAPGVLPVLEQLYEGGPLLEPALREAIDPAISDAALRGALLALRGFELIGATYPPGGQHRLVAITACAVDLIHILSDLGAWRREAIPATSPPATSSPIRPADLTVAQTIATSGANATGEAVAGTTHRAGHNTAVGDDGSGADRLVESLLLGRPDSAS